MPPGVPWTSPASQVTWWELLMHLAHATRCSLDQSCQPGHLVRTVDALGACHPVFPGPVLPARSPGENSWCTWRMPPGVPWTSPASQVTWWEQLMHLAHATRCSLDQSCQPGHLVRTVDALGACHPVFPGPVLPARSPGENCWCTWCMPPQVPCTYSSPSWIFSVLWDLIQLW